MKLTKSMIEKGVRAFVEKKYDPIIETEIDKVKKVGDLIYAEITKGQEDFIKNLLPGWYTESGSFWIYPNKRPRNFLLSTSKRTPISTGFYEISTETNLDMLDKLIDRYDDASGIVSLKRQKKGNLLLDLSVFAKQFTTLEKLAEHNQDLADLCGAGVVNNTVNAPAITCRAVLEKYPEIIGDCT